MDSEQLRSRIDSVDARLVELLNERLLLAREIVALKNGQCDDSFKLGEESACLKRLYEINSGPLENETIRSIYSGLFAEAVELEKPPDVAFLGPATTFTHQAALSQFGERVRYIPQKNITEIFESVERGKAEYGVVPVENSTEGAVTHTLDMFADSSVKICAEINTPIHHNLLSMSTSKDQLRVLYTHPQVFGQCRLWLQKNLPGLPLVEVSSTTEAAARCIDEPYAGALASVLAAKRHKLQILEESIEDFSDNVTRFLVLSRHQAEPTGDDKTSVIFAVRDRVGALYDSLYPLKTHGLNLTFIESRPSRRKSWEYIFFIDILGHISDPVVGEALDELREHCQFLNVMGSYPRGTRTTRIDRAGNFIREDDIPSSSS